MSEPESKRNEREWCLDMEELKEVKNGAELKKATLSRALVNCERNIVGFQKNWGTKSMLDPRERASRVRTGGTNERGVG